MKGTMLAAMFVLISAGVFWFVPAVKIKHAEKQTADGKYGYAVILGAKVNGEIPSLSLQRRLEAAAEYAERFPKVIFVLAGGQGADEEISEAEAMKRYLLQRGIAEERLLLEEQSTSTYENLLYAKELLPEAAGVTIISSDYHLARAQFLAGQLGWETDTVAASTPNSIKAKVLVRERAALFKTWIMRK